MTQQYVPIPDSLTSLLGRRLMDINTKEIFLINTNGQVMKMIPIAKNGLLSSPDKKIDINKYIESNTRDIAIITELKRKGVKHVSKPTTDDELEYKRARNRINRRKAYLKERAEQLKISLPSNDDIKKTTQLILESDATIQKQHLTLEQLSTVPHQVMSSALVELPLSTNTQHQAHLILQESSTTVTSNINRVENKLVSINNLDNLQERKTIFNWWNERFGLNYIKLRNGYLGQCKEIIPMLGECEIEYFVPNNDIDLNITISHNEFQNKLDKYHVLARNLTISDRLDHINNTKLQNLNFTFEIMETQSSIMIDPIQIEKLLLNGKIINPNKIVCN